MKLKSNLGIVFSIFLIMMLSLSMASAEDLDDSIISDLSDANSNVITTDSSPDSIEQEKMGLDDNLISDMPDENTLISEDSSLNINVDENNESELNNKAIKGSSKLGDSEEQYYLENIIRNPSFKIADDNNYPAYWIVYDYWPSTHASHAKIVSESHDGDGASFKMVTGDISQYLNFDFIETINFYINRDSCTVNIGDEFAQKYRFSDSPDYWNLISIDTSNIHGVQLFRVDYHGLVDDFFVTYNGNENFANFTWNLISSNSTDFTVQFTDESYGLIGNWLWDFGDGTTSTERNPVHTYKIGTYNPVLTLSNSNYESKFNTTIGDSLPKILRTGEVFGSIQSAIDNAVDGDTILVNPVGGIDVFYENLVINKSLSFVFNESKLSPASAKALITLKKANVTFDGLILENIKSTISGDASSILNLNNSYISNVTITATNKLNIYNGLINLTTFNFRNYNVNIKDSLLSQTSTLRFTNSNVTMDNFTFDSRGNKNLIASNSEISLGNCELNRIALNLAGTNLNLFNSSLIDISSSSINKSNIDIRDSNFTNSNYFISINGSDLIMDNIKTEGLKEFKLIDSNSSISNSYFTSSNCPINQTGGKLNISSTIFHNNAIGINVESGNANIHFNTFFNNTKYSLRYRDGVDFADNWWGSNEPAFVSSLTDPESADIYHVGDSSSSLSYPYLVLNLTSPTDLMACNSSYSMAVDLTHNNLGEDTSSSGTVHDMNLKFISSVGNTTVCQLVDGRGSFDFLTGAKSANEVNFTYLNNIFTFPIAIDNTVPQITYITPGGKFKDIITVEITCDESDAIIYYTLDGTSPLNSSTRLVYTEPFALTESSTVHVTAIDAYGNYARSIFINSTDVSVNYIKEVDIGDSEAVWSEYQGYLNNTGVSGYDGPLTNVSKWSREDIISSASAVIDKDGNIFIVSDDGNLYCINTQGKVVWYFNSRSKIISTPVIGPNGNIFFQNWENSTLYEIKTNGSLVWKYELGEFNTGAGVKIGDDGTVYAISGNDDKSTLFAFKDHKLFWSLDLPASLDSTPAIGPDGSIYVVCKNHHLACINWDGTLKGYIYLDREDWIYGDRYNLIEYYVSASVDSDGTVYVLNLPVGQLVHGEQLYSKAVAAYYPNGTLKWSNNIGIVYGTPSIANGKVYIVGSNKLYAFDIETGDLLWSNDICNASYSASAPLVSSNGIVYLAHNNTVYAFGDDGAEIWSYVLTGQYDNPIALSGPAISNDGTLIVTTTQGIYAFNDISADFTWEHKNGTVRSIQFTDLSIEGDNTYSWDFGDYRTSKQQNPVHDYFRTGNYTVVLRVNHSGVILTRNMTVEVVDYDITPPSDIIATIDNRTAINASYRGSQTVVLNSSDNWGEYTIYYTVDGSNPIDSSTRREYFEPILVEATTTLRYVAVDPSGNWANVGELTLNITDAIVVNETLVEKIQKILDEAEAGSTVQINYENVSGANFTINKPLTIVTNNNTLLVGNGVDPVFRIGANANGTKINGFTLENVVDTVVINGSSNVTVLNTHASSSYGVGFNIINSSNTLIKDSSSDDSYYGIVVNKSSNIVLNRVNVTDSYDIGLNIKNSKNTIVNNSNIVGNGKYYEGRSDNILIDNDTGVSILNTYIADGYFGIHFKNSNKNIDIINNTIFETIADGILLEGMNNGLNIIHNEIDGSFNGLNFNGYSKNVVVTNNLVWNVRGHTGDPDLTNAFNQVYSPNPWGDTYGQYNNAVQISAGSQNFGDGVFMENNIFIKQEHRSWEARHTQDKLSSNYNGTFCSGHSYNLWDGSGSYFNTGGVVGYSSGLVDLVVDKIDDSTFRMRLINRRTGEYLSNIPAFPVTVTAGTYSQVVNFEGDKAIAKFNTATVITDVKFKISMHIQKSIKWDAPITDPEYKGSTNDTDGGYHEGEAYVKPVNPVNPPMPDNGGGNSGNGNSNGNGNGHGSGFGNGTGTGTGEGQNSGNGSGRFNINAGGDQPGGVDGPVSAVFSQSQSTGGDADSTDNPNAGGSDGKAYEIEETHDITSESIAWNLPAAIILFIVLSFFILIGYYREENEEE